MPNRIHPLNSSSVSSGRVHAPGAGQTQGPRGPQGPSPTHPKTLDRIGPLAGLVSRGMRPAKEADSRPRSELPRSRDGGGSRSWMSSMKHAASKTGHAISHGFNKAGHALHKLGHALNEPNGDPSWMRYMNEEERAHYDYYGEMPAESSNSSHASHYTHSSQSTYVAAPWEQQSSYVAAPWEQPTTPSRPSSPSYQSERTEVRQRPMTPTEQAAENEAARYHGYEPGSTVEEYVSRPSSPSLSRVSSSSSSQSGSVRTRPMTPTEQAAANEEARYHGVEPRTQVEEFVPSAPASPQRPARTNRDALLANIRETIPRMNLNRLDFAEPRDFVRLAQTLTDGTPYERMMDGLVRDNPALGASMKQNWGALRQHLNGLRAQGNENVPTMEWLFANRPSRMMNFLVEGSGGGRLVRPTTRH